MIPLVNSKVARQSVSRQESWWRGPVRWIVAVLALAAALDAAYLTWTSYSHSVVAGCDGISLANCDLVLSSTWSRWLFLPVALGGALCYAGVFVLSLLAGRLNDEAGRWASTLLMMMSLVAAGAGLWFTFVQIVLLGTFCPHCIATHLCGLVIAGLVMWMYFRRSPDSIALWQSRGSLAAIPGGGVRRPAMPRPSLGPSLAVAASGAAGMLALLIVGQILLPPQTVQATKPKLDEAIDMTVEADPSPPESSDSDELSPDAQTHVVNRISDSDESVEPPIEEEAPKEDPVATGDTAGDAEVPPAVDSTAADSSAAEDSAAEEVAKVEPAKPQAPALAREVRFLNGRVKINSYNEAILGSPEAPYMIIEMMDYTCPHCREMHKSIKRAKEHYGEKLAVVIMPVPLEMECNKLMTTTNPTHRGACRMARLALSVAKVDPDAFTDFHNWLLADEKNPPTAVRTLNRAWGLVDQKELSEISNGNEIKLRMEKYINLYAALVKQYTTKEKPFGLPVQIVGDTVFTGKFETEEKMYEAWDKALGIKPE